MNSKQTSMKRNPRGSTSLRARAAALQGLETAEPEIEPEDRPEAPQESVPPVKPRFKERFVSMASRRVITKPEVMVALKPVEPEPTPPPLPPRVELVPVESVAAIEDRFDEDLTPSEADPHWPPPLPGNDPVVMMVCTKGGKVTVYGEATGNPYFFAKGRSVAVHPRDVPGLKAKRRSAYATSRGEGRFFIEKE